MMIVNSRTVETYNNGNWGGTALDQIKPGDRFRLFEIDSTGKNIVVDPHGGDSWIAASYPYKSDGDLCVKVMS